MRIVTLLLLLSIMGTGYGQKLIAKLFFRHHTKFRAHDL